MFARGVSPSVTRLCRAASVILSLTWLVELVGCGHDGKARQREERSVLEVVHQPIPQPMVGARPFKPDSTMTSGAMPSDGDRMIPPVGIGVPPRGQPQLPRKTINARSLAATDAPLAPEVDETSPYPVVPVAEDDGELGLPLVLGGAGEKALTHFRAAMARTERKEHQTRAIFFGASHVASDWFTGEVRDQLQRRFGDAGHGFVLPARPWRTYRHLNVWSSSNWKKWTSDKVYVADTEIKRLGLMGTYVESEDAAAFGAVGSYRGRGIGRKVSRFQLFYEQRPDGGSMRVLIDGKLRETLATQAEDFRPAIAEYEVPDGSHQLRIEVVGDGPVRIFGTTLERDAPGVIVDTAGINGSRIRYQMLWDRAYFEAFLTARKPDLIVLAYGTNESGDDTPIENYAEELGAVIERAQEIVPDASCLLIGPTDRPIRTPEGIYVDRPRTRQVAETQDKVAAAYGCAFVDMVAFQGGALSMPAWVANDPPLAAPDHIHLTRKGYQRFAGRLVDTLLGETRPASVP